MPRVEQNKLKRSGIGLRACDHERAFPGFTLFAPQSGGGKVDDKAFLCALREIFRF